MHNNEQKIIPSHRIDHSIESKIVAQMSINYQSSKWKRISQLQDGKHEFRKV